MSNLLAADGSLDVPPCQPTEAGAELLYAVADATWRCEAAKTLNLRADDPGLDRSPEAQGRPGTLLRTSYEVRERAYADWQRLLKSVRQ